MKLSISTMLACAAKFLNVGNEASVFQDVGPLFVVAASFNRLARLGRMKEKEEEKEENDIVHDIEEKDPQKKELQLLRSILKHQKRTEKQHFRSLFSRHL
jgi:hypothetical protein